MLKGYENKKIYIQLSNKFNLSFDILIYIYNLVQQSYIKEEDIQRIFYKNIMIFNLMDYKEWPMLSLPASLLEDKIEEKNPNAFRSFPSLKDDIFKHRLPDNKGLEWVIKSYPTTIYNRMKTYINILGEENLFIEEGAVLNCAIINASSGPVYIGKDAEIMEGSMIRGPFAMLNNSIIKMGSKIYMYFNISVVLAKSFFTSSAQE